jgi:hypothetical protein
MRRPDVTVIIPTRERAATFEHCLRTVTDQRHGSLEIIVSDNASTDGTAAIAAANADPRIRYLNTGRRLSMSANWEFALSHATGEWVGFLGDDDGLLPGGVEDMLRIAGTTSTRLVRCRPCDYLWPPLAGGADGRLVVPARHRTDVVDGRAALARLAAGEVHYTRLPTLYSGGFVHRDLIEAGRGPDGRFFRSQIPDVYSAVRLAALGEPFAYTTRPYALNGISGMSTGISVFARTQAHDKAKPAKLFAAEDNMPLHPTVPASATGGPPPSIQALVFESYQQVRELEPTLPALDPHDQLAIILRAAALAPDALSEWASRFARANNISDPPRPPLASLQGTWERWEPRLRMDRIIVSDHHRPQVGNVHSAALMAQAVIDRDRPSLAAILLNQARFAATMLQARFGRSEAA